MGEEMVWRAAPCRSQMPNRPLHVDRVPADNRRDHEVEPGRTEVLVLESAVGDPPLAMDIDSLGEEMARFALVEAGLATAPQLRIFEPIEGK